MFFRLQLISDRGDVIHEDYQRLNPGFDLEVELSQPIVRYTMQGLHRVAGYKISFREYIEHKERQVESCSSPIERVSS